MSHHNGLVGDGGAYIKPSEPTRHNTRKQPPKTQKKYELKQNYINKPLYYVIIYTLPPQIFFL
jgi:hypothetical protein